MEQRPPAPTSRSTVDTVGPADGVLGQRRPRPGPARPGPNEDGAVASRCPGGAGPHPPCMSAGPAAALPAGIIEFDYGTPPGRGLCVVSHSHHDTQWESHRSRPRPGPPLDVRFMSELHGHPRTLPDQLDPHPALGSGRSVRRAYRHFHGARLPARQPQHGRPVRRIRRTPRRSASPTTDDNAIGRLQNRRSRPTERLISVIGSAVGAAAARHRRHRDNRPAKRSASGTNVLTTQPQTPTACRCDGPGGHRRRCSRIPASAEHHPLSDFVGSLCAARLISELD